MRVISQDEETIFRGDIGNRGVSERVEGAASNHLAKANENLQ